MTRAARGELASIASAVLLLTLVSSGGDPVADGALAGRTKAWVIPAVALLSGVRRLWRWLDRQ